MRSSTDSADQSASAFIPADGDRSGQARQYYNYYYLNRKHQMPPRPAVLPEVEQAALASDAMSNGQKRWRTLSNMNTHVTSMAASIRSINYVDPLFWHMQEVRSSAQHGIGTASIS